MKTIEDERSEPRTIALKDVPVGEIFTWGACVDPWIKTDTREHFRADGLPESQYIAPDKEVYLCESVLSWRVKRRSLEAVQVGEEAPE